MIKFKDLRENEFIIEDKHIIGLKEDEYYCYHLIVRTIGEIEVNLETFERIRRLRNMYA